MSLVDNVLILSNRWVLATVHVSKTLRIGDAAAYWIQNKDIMVQTLCRNHIVSARRDAPGFPV